MQLAERALAAGKSVLQEKPIAQTAAEAHAAVARHQPHSGGAVWAIAENYRCRVPAELELRGMLVGSFIDQHQLGSATVQVREGVPGSRRHGFRSRAPRQAGPGGPPLLLACSRTATPHTSQLVLARRRRRCSMTQMLACWSMHW